MNGLRNEQMDKFRNREEVSQTDRHVNGLLDGQTGRWMDIGHMDKQIVF